VLAGTLEEQIQQPRFGANRGPLRLREVTSHERSRCTAGLEAVPHQAGDEIRKSIDAGTPSAAARNDRTRNDVDHVPIEPLHGCPCSCPSMPVVGRTYKCAMPCSRWWIMRMASRGGVEADKENGPH